MPKILRIINRFNLGGPTFNAAYLTKYMAPEFETLLIGGVKEETEDSSEFIVQNLGIEPQIISQMKRSVNPLNDRATYKEIKQIIKTFKPDIVHTHASKAGTLGRLAASKLNVPVIIHTFHGHVFHSYFNAFKSNIYLNIERHLAKKTSCIIAISDKQKEELANRFKLCESEKIKVIPLGFDLTKFNEDQEQKRTSFRKEFNIKEDEIAIGIVGRLAPIKNHLFFLKAMKEVFSKTTKKVRAVIVGNGQEMEALQEFCTQNRLSFATNGNVSDEEVIFTSWRKDVDVVNAGIDIAALSSLNEGTPVSLIEAQAGRKPIVSTNVGGIENIVLPGQTALLSKPDDLSLYVKNMLWLIENKIEREKMAALGWEFVKKKFHYNRLIDDMSNTYRQLLN